MSFNPMAIEPGMTLDVKGTIARYRFVLTQEDIDRGYVDVMIGVYYHTTGGLDHMGLDLDTITPWGFGIVRHGGWWYLVVGGEGETPLPRSWELSWS